MSMPAPKPTGGQPPPKKFKVVLLGESGVGKSSLVLRLVKDEWLSSQHSTVGASFFRHSVPVNGQSVNFDIWDTAGQERYKSLASMYYRGAAAALVVYDITNMDSFERARYWIQQLIANSPETIVVLVGNKVDREADRMVPKDEAKRLAGESGLTPYEASAKEGTKVAEIFKDIATRLVEKGAAAQTVNQGGVVGRDGQRMNTGGKGGATKKNDKCDC
jgi:Ras-related protein Rab-5C